MDWKRVLGGWGVVVAMAAGLPAVASAAEGQPQAMTPAAETRAVRVDFRGQAASAEARGVAEWALGSGDTQGRPFAIVDKQQARLFVFAASGRLIGATPALLGLARGDDSAPGVAQKVSTGIPLQERTTPAGRFDSAPGRNLKGEAIVWVDYSTAIAIHRLRTAAPEQRRPQRLASPTPADNRISLGCVVVDDGFYDQVVAPTLGRQRGVVYVLPETRDWREEFGIASAAESL